MGQHIVLIAMVCQLTTYFVYAVCCGQLKPLIGQDVTESTAGHVQQQLVVWSATGVTSLAWHIVCVNTMSGWASIRVDCRSHEQKLYC